MDDAAPTSGVGSESGRRVTAAIAIGGVVTVVAALVLAVSNIEVGNGADGTRSCGSVFDSVADRSGWEVWLANDLDEPDDAFRSELLRTTECPGAVNRRLALAGITAAFGASMAVVTGARLRRHRTPPTAPVGSRLTRLGRATTTVGAVLTAGGVAAIAVLVADADSTLFLYVDRTVVALIGLIVLVPTIALIAIGRALTLVAPHLVERDHSRPDIDPDVDVP